MDRLNKNQRLAATAGIVVIVLMVLFPPWSSVETIGGLSDGFGPTALQVTKAIGYGFLFSPPAGPESNQYVDAYVQVAVGKLLLQIVAVAGVAAGLIFMLKGSKQ